VVVRTEPDTFATLTDLGAGVRFVFDERISENVAGGQLDDAVTVSPSHGDVRVRHGRNSLSVDVEGGFRPGLIYRVTLLSVVRDMFGNELVDPFELVFSTGGQPSPSALAGQVWSRVSGQGVSGALVRAIGGDSLVHVARADGSGIYAFRYLPGGSYRVTAFEDVDRDRDVDAREPQGTVDAELAAGDTLLIDVPTLPTDTTAAVAASASALDSVTVVLELDDYVDPDAPASAVTVTLAREDGTAPGVARLFHEREYGAYVDEVADSLAVSPDSTGGAAIDTARAPPAQANGGAAPPVGPPGRPVPPRLDGARQGSSGRPLPTRRFVVLLDAPLEAEVEYQLSVSDVTNINGVTGGGGEVTLMLRAREMPAPARDTTGLLR
jgi:hypothetical protein